MKIENTRVTTFDPHDWGILQEHVLTQTEGPGAEIDDGAGTGGILLRT